MLAERRRVLRLLSDRTHAALWTAWIADRTADWVFLLTVLVAAWDQAIDVRTAALALVAWWAPRLVLWALFDQQLRRLTALSWPALVLAKAGATAMLLLGAVFGVAEGVTLLLAASGVMGFITALSAEARSAALDRVAAADRGTATLAAAFVDRLALVVGGATAAMCLYLIGPFSVALTVALALFVAAAALSYARLRRAQRAPGGRTPDVDDEADPSELRGIARPVALYLVAAFATGALASVLLIATLDIAVISAAVEVLPATPVLVAAAGLGMLLGPIPVPRALLRVPAPVIVLSLIVAAAAIAIVVAMTRSAPVAFGALVVFGLAVVSLDAVRAIALRRLAPAAHYPRIARLSILALSIGQVYGAVSLLTVTSADPFALLLVLAVAQVLLVALAVALGGRSSVHVGGLSTLPIKSVVHSLSWEAVPPVQAAAYDAGSPRVRRLAAWINRTVQLETVTAILPRSGREYSIARPTTESRERLFDAGRADPEKQMPFWAKVWPSGVALADVVVERKSEVTGSRVLELGAGLGVTACAVLEYGGDLVTADYSSLPLAHCRLNTLVNTDRAPGATCFNWRHPAEVRAAKAQPEFAAGFPLVLAADVLYEGRDAVPLLNVMEQMLTPDGQVWLAEPVRRTAQRFLDSAAQLSWDVESRQVQADWPDATSGPVNIHFLKRSREPDRVTGDLGGWRI